MWHCEASSTNWVYPLLQHHITISSFLADHIGTTSELRSYWKYELLEKFLLPSWPIYSFCDKQEFWKTYASWFQISSLEAPNLSNYPSIVVEAQYILHLWKYPMQLKRLDCCIQVRYFALKLCRIHWSNGSWPNSGGGWTKLVTSMAFQNACPTNNK